MDAAKIYDNLIILSWFNCFNTEIYLKVRWASVECWNASNIFFKATVAPVFLSFAFHTCPYAPDPNFFMIWYFYNTWGYIF